MNHVFLFVTITVIICLLMFVLSIFEIRRTEKIGKIVLLLMISAQKKNVRESKELLKLLTEERAFYISKSSCENINNIIIETIEGEDTISPKIIIALRNFYVNGKFNA